MESTDAAVTADGSTPFGASTTQWWILVKDKIRIACYLPAYLKWLFSLEYLRT
jgi:hypothetical protein